MLPDQGKSSLGLEYFCSEGDALWTMADADLIELGKRELDKLNLARYDEVEDGCVFRVPKSYPVYDSGYRESLDVVREYVDGLENFQTIGRNGLHRYNNQDHAMLTGMLAVRNMVLGQKNDLWNVNAEQEYHEEVRSAADAAVNTMASVVQGALARAFMKLDRAAFGLSLGVMAGLVLFLATLFLVIKGGPDAGSNLALLGHFFPGYDVDPFGAVLGLGYGFLTGFVVGWGVAFLRNTVVFLYMAFVHRQSEYRLLRKLMEHL